MNVAPDEQERRAKHVPLFRPEAVEYSRMQWLGEFHLSTPIGARVLTYFLLATVALLIVLLFTLQYTRRVEVAGELRADPGIAPVAATQSGDVRAVYVVEGERVHAGQPLFAVGANHVLNICKTLHKRNSLHFAQRLLLYLRSPPWTRLGETRS